MLKENLLLLEQKRKIKENLLQEREASINFIKKLMGIEGYIFGTITNNFIIFFNKDNENDCVMIQYKIIGVEKVYIINVF